MTAKELHKLSRQDLLQLLLAQSREVARQKENIEELKGLLKKERELSARLKEKLNEKDDDITRLAEKLNDKDENIGRLKDKLNGKDEIFERLKNRLDEKDMELNEAQEDAETLRQSVESLRTRLDEKDEALESARARLDRMGPETARRNQSGRGVSAYSAPVREDWRSEAGTVASVPAGEDWRRDVRNSTPVREDFGRASVSGTRRREGPIDENEERRRYLKELLARREAEGR